MKVRLAATVAVMFFALPGAAHAFGISFCGGPGKEFVARMRSAG